MRSLDTRFHDEALALGSVGRVLLVVSRRPMRLEHATHLRRLAHEHRTRWREETATIAVIEATALQDFSDEVRKEIAGLAKDFESLATANVIEGSGFRAVAGRTLLAGLSLVARWRRPQKVFESTHEAAAWIARSVAAHGLDVPSATEIDEAIGSLRATLDPLLQGAR